MRMIPLCPMPGPRTLDSNLSVLHSGSTLGNMGEINLENFIQGGSLNLTLFRIWHEACKACHLNNNDFARDRIHQYIGRRR